MHHGIAEKKFFWNNKMVKISLQIYVALEHTVRDDLNLFFKFLDLSVLDMQIEQYF